MARKMKASYAEHYYDSSLNSGFTVLNQYLVYRNRGFQIPNATGLAAIFKFRSNNITITEM
jgi:hypothetical protein